MPAVDICTGSPLRGTSADWSKTSSFRRDIPFPRLVGRLLVAGRSLNEGHLWSIGSRKRASNTAVYVLLSRRGPSDHVDEHEEQDIARSGAAVARPGASLLHHWSPI